MKFTIEKSKLIEKLQAARAVEVKNLETVHKAEVEGFQERLKEVKANLHKALKEIDKGYIPHVDGVYSEKRKPKPKDTSKEINNIDAAIAVLNIVNDQQITLDDRADKWNLIGLLKDALG